MTSYRGTLPATGVALAGFMGVGKSTVGPLLAARLGLPWWDLDDRIEQRTGRRIPEIFASDGESGFRHVERLALEAGLSEGAAVVSLGGGALLDLRARERLAELGWKTVVLTAPWSEIHDRIRDSGRPLAPFARERMVDRLHHYASLGPSVDTTGCTPDEVAARAMALVAPKDASE